MGGGQVAHVDVVADAGAIGGGIVAAIHLDRGPPAGQGLQHQGDQVGFRVVVLADVTGGVGAGGVEVAEDHAGLAVGGAEIGQQLLHHPLAAAVGVDRLLGGALADGDVLGNRDAVGGAGGAEHQRNRRAAPQALLAQGLEQHQGVAQIVAVVLGRLAHALAHVGVGGEVQHGLHRSGGQLGVGTGEQGIEQGAVAQLAHHQRHRQHVFGDGAVAIHQVVEHQNGLAGLLQGPHRVAADVAGAAGDQNRHGERGDWGRLA